MKRTALIITAALAFAFATTLTPTGAHAAPRDPDPGDLERLVKKADPRTKTTGRVSVSNGRVRADGLEVALEARNPQTLASDTVLTGEGVDYVARGVDDGFQIAAVITDPAQHTQTYRFPGRYLERLADGQVLVRADGRFGEPIGVIDPPWAVDANGASIPSKFLVDGDTLTQVTSLGSRTAYPVVADPRVRVAWYGYSVDFTKAETKKIAIAGNACTAFLGFAGVIATKAGLVATAVVGLLASSCATIGVLSDVAYESGRCISLKLFTIVPGATAPWINKCYA